MKLKKVIAGIMAAVVSASVLLSNDIPSLVINASAASTDGYSDEYGITEMDLYQKYPDYLSDGAFVDSIMGLNKELLKMGGEADTTLNTVIYSILNGGKFIETEFKAALGLGDSTVEQCCDKVVMSIVQEIQGSDKAVYSYMKKVSKQYSKVIN